MQAPRLDVSIKTQFAPKARRVGFKGSGRTFRRVEGELIQVVNFQGSRYGGEFAVNLAVQPLSIPDVLGNLPNPRTITESLCEFRRRLTTTGSDQWWPYGLSQAAMDRAVAEATCAFQDIALGLFEQIAGVNSPLLTTTGAEFDEGTYSFAGFGSTKTRMALVLMRLRLRQGEVEEARAFAKIGLKNIGRAAAIRAEFENVLAS